MRVSRSFLWSVGFMLDDAMYRSGVRNAVEDDILEDSLILLKS